MRISDWSSDVCSSDLLTVTLRDLTNTARSNMMRQEEAAAAGKAAGEAPPLQAGDILMGATASEKQRNLRRAVKEARVGLPGGVREAGLKSFAVPARPSRNPKSSGGGRSVAAGCAVRFGSGELAEPERPVGAGRGRPLEGGGQGEERRRQRL